MKAIVLEEYNKLVYRDVEDPQPAPGEVLIRVKACGICGSDVHGMDGSTGRRQPPIIMGHEASGVVAALGEGARGHGVGERVTFDSTIYCGTCEYCRSGRVNLCEARRVLGVSCPDYRTHGAFAEYVTVPARLLVPLPDGVDFVRAAMAEPLSVAYHAVRRTEAEGRACLVVGAGTIGMLAVLVLRALGAGRIIACDIDGRKRDFALAHGADGAVDSAEPDALARVLALTEGGEGVDAAFDAVGIEPTMNLCIEATRRGGDVVLVGNLAPRALFPLQSVVTRELRVLGSCASAGEYPECLRLIAEKRLDVMPLIGACAPLSEGDRWIQRVKRGELGKVVLIPEGAD